MKVFIGYDERESEAVRVAVKTLREVTNGEVEPVLLAASKLAANGLLTRLSDHRGGQDYDLVSNAFNSTRFAVSRFLTPMLAHTGYALFVDCDMVFREDPRNMLREVNPLHAISVVQHAHEPVEQWKMINQRQTSYPRKNWSSVMLFNCDHLANQRLTLGDVNARTGRDLHALYWLHDAEIGALDARWNWLVNVQPEPGPGGIAHFTLGGPWFDAWVPAAHDDIWLTASR